MTLLARTTALSAALLLAGGIVAVSLPAASSQAAAATTKLCNSDTTPVGGGTYWLNNDEWASSAPECITTDGGTDFKVAYSSIQAGQHSPPGGYPFIYKGCHYGACTPASGFPIQVSDIGAGRVTTSWSTSQPGGSNVYNVAYDVWFNQQPATSGAPNGTELMIWLNHRGHVRPYGSQVASGVSIGGHSYNVWFGKQAWNTVSYSMTTAATSVSNLDLQPLIADAVSRGYISRSWYLIDVEAGFELWNSGAGLATKSFSVNVGDPLACNASVSHRRPADHSTTTVTVRTAANAEVTAVAHFRSGNRRRTARATAHGVARILYATRTAPPGSRVWVSVTARLGKRTGTCRTWFTPRRG